MPVEMPVEFEPYSRLFQDDPYPTYRALRDHDPIHYAPNSEVWCISRYEDVEFVLTHPDLFSSKTPLRGSGSDVRKMGPIDRTILIHRCNQSNEGTFKSALCHVWHFLFQPGGGEFASSELRHFLH